MVYVHLAEGFEEIEALTCVDLLRRAEIEVTTVSMEESKTVTGAHGIEVNCETYFTQVDYSQAEMIVLPGGMPGTTNLLANERLCDHVRNFVDQERWVAAICAAPMILGRLGLLEGRSAVCYTGMEDELKGAEVPDQKVVVDGHIITSKGPGTAMDFALAIIEALEGQTVAKAVKDDLLYQG